MFKVLRALPIIVILLSLAVVVPTFAAQSVSKGLTLYSPAKVGNTELQAGDYWITFDGSKLTFTQHKVVVVEVKAQWVDTKVTAESDSILVEKGAITEIRIDGRKQVIKVL